MKRQTQRDRVLEWLKKNGTLTTRDAVVYLNIMSLPKRIEELRKLGHPITMRWMTTESGCRYGVYKLAD